MHTSTIEKISDLIQRIHLYRRRSYSQQNPFELVRLLLELEASMYYTFRVSSQAPAQGENDPSEHPKTWNSLNQGLNQFHIQEPFHSEQLQVTGHPRVGVASNSNSLIGAHSSPAGHTAPFIPTSTRPTTSQHSIAAPHPVPTSSVNQVSPLSTYIRGRGGAHGGRIRSGRLEASYRRVAADAMPTLQTPSDSASGLGASQAIIAQDNNTGESEANLDGALTVMLRRFTETDTSKLLEEAVEKFFDRQAKIYTDAIMEGEQGLADRFHQAERWLKDPALQSNTQARELAMKYVGTYLSATRELDRAAMIEAAIKRIFALPDFLRTLEGTLIKGVGRMDSDDPGPSASNVG